MIKWIQNLVDHNFFFFAWVNRSNFLWKMHNEFHFPSPDWSMQSMKIRKCCAAINSIQFCLSFFLYKWQFIFSFIVPFFHFFFLSGSLKHSPGAGAKIQPPSDLFPNCIFSMHSITRSDEQTPLKRRWMECSIPEFAYTTHTHIH